MEYYSAIKKNEIMPFAVIWVDMEIIILSEISQTEKYKYHMRSLRCGISKKSYTSELIYKTETDMDLENKFMVTIKDQGEGSREGLRGGTNWEFGIGICNNQQGPTV